MTAAIVCCLNLLTAMTRVSDTVKSFGAVRDVGMDHLACVIR
jgi:hypothetical protein